MASTESSDSPMALRRACVSRLLKPASTRMRARLVAMKVQFPELLLARIQTLTMSGLRALSLNKQDRTWGGRSLGERRLGVLTVLCSYTRAAPSSNHDELPVFGYEDGTRNLSPLGHRVLEFMNRKY